jgi:multidrug efflux pump subunit AcrB
LWGRESALGEVITTIFVAILLLVGVVFLFLQSWCAAIILVIATPVSLVGTFTVLYALGISLNNLSLFGLVLAVGIVVDDAIVVAENVERNLERVMTPAKAAHVTMDEVGVPQRICWHSEHIRWRALTQTLGVKEILPFHSKIRKAILIVIAGQP